MGKNITLSSNIPIVLPEKLSQHNFGVGFLYPSGKGLELKDGKTWFEKVCLSLNKMNAVIGFQHTDLKIPEYIAETINTFDNEFKENSLLIRYNAQTTLNDVVSKISPEKNRHSFDDQLSTSFSKGTPMVIIGERSLKKTFPYFEEKYGLKTKIKFILHHEIAHNIDAKKNYERGEYSLKNIMEEHLSSVIDRNVTSPFISIAQLHQTKKMIKQIWTLSLEHYADTLGFLHMRNELLDKNMSYKDIHSMLDVLIHERKEMYKNNIHLLEKKRNNRENYIDFEEKYQCLNHLTVNALTEIKNFVVHCQDKKLTSKEIEKITIDIVKKADLKSLYIMSKVDTKTSELLEKLLTSQSKNGILENCLSKKMHYEEVIKQTLDEHWLKEIDKYSTMHHKKSFYEKINDTFGLTSNELNIQNKKQLNKKIQHIRCIILKSDIKNERKI